MANISAVQYSTGTWMAMIGGKVSCTHDHRTKSEAMKCARDSIKRSKKIKKTKRTTVKIKKKKVPVSFIVQVPIHPSDIERATVIAEDIGKLRNSIRRGAGNLVGALGEILVRKYVHAKQSNTYDYDLVKDNGRLEVKTKECTSPPEPHFNCTVAAYNTKQDCDFYVFVRVLKDMNTAWILGFMDKDTFFKTAYFGKEGDIDPNSAMKWRFKADCYNIRIDQLIPISELDRYLKRI